MLQDLDLLKKFIMHDFGMPCKILQDLGKILQKNFCWEASPIMRPQLGRTFLVVDCPTTKCLNGLFLHIAKL